MPKNRSGGRNVHFYDARNPEKVLGGLILDQRGSVTEAVFLTMLEILIISTSPYEVRHRASAKVVSSDAIPLATGHYDIHCLASDGRALVFPWACALLSNSMTGTIQITDEAVLTRASSHHITGRDDRFRREVRARDGGCVVTHIMNPDGEYDRWDGFEAAHIFPLAYESHFTSQGLSRWITNKRGDSDTGINSCQNGLLLREDIHTLFDNYKFSIHVDVSSTCMEDRPPETRER